MAILTVLGRPSGGGSQQAAPGDTLILPNTCQSAAGQQLTLSSTMGALIIGATGLLLAGGAGGLDFSPGSGPFLTSTGAVTLGPGAISVTGNMTMQAGTLLATTGTGNVNLPNNASARFQIQGISVSANVTAANLGTLTAGAASNADALHTHSGVGSNANYITGLTLFAAPVAGEVGYVSGNNAIARALATSVTTAKAVGVADGVDATRLLVGPKVPLLFEAGLAVAANDKFYLSMVTAGRFTNDVSAFGPGDVENELGYVLDVSAYVPGTGVGAFGVWQPKSTIQL